MGRKKIYFNDAQRRVQLVSARTSVVVAGRRTGKTDSIAGPYTLKCMQRMPRSGGGIIVPTFKHGLTNTIPGMLAFWKRYGFIEGIHYVVGKVPPKHFNEPLVDPKCYEHVITMHNGSIAYILSQDRSYSANSLTLSWMLVDEARFVDYGKLQNEGIAALGGNKVFFGKHSCWNSRLILSDMPQSQKGSWFLHYKDKMDPELIAVIEATVYELYKVREKISQFRKKGISPPDYLSKYVQKQDAILNKLRSQAVYYKEYSSIENIQLLGVDYIRQMRRDLTPLTFQTSILCQRIGVAKDGFYSSMRDKHLYNASDMSFLDERFHAGNYSPDMDSKADADVDPNMPIYIGMDYNANINWIVAGQPDYDNARLNVIKSFFVKFERKIPELIDDFCIYYADHPVKVVVYYFDATALGSNYAVNNEDFRWVVENRFARNGWRCECVYIGQPMKHHEKYLLINEAFRGRRNLQPFFNQQNNPDLILAIQSAGVERGRNGFRKYKEGEKLKETEENPLELRTDGTDAFDNLYIGCEKFPYNASSVFIGTSIM